MLFNYTSVDTKGQSIPGSIEAVNIDVAINSLQRRGLTVSSITPADKPQGFLKHNISLFDRVSNGEVVILSRQISTLFEAQVSALRVFQLLGEQQENPVLKKALLEVSTDIQGGSTISKALAKFPKIFSDFFVNMVVSGEESGKLDMTFQFLADYLDRSYAVTMKARNALIYPAFIIVTFFSVMILMFTMVIPRISSILIDSGQAIPFVTRVIITISSFLVNYGVFAVIILIICGILLFRFFRTDAGSMSLARFKITMPYIGTLYKKLYLSRIADNLNTMILSGIPMLRVLEITTAVVGNRVYEDILKRCYEAVKAGSALSDALARSPEIPGIMMQMIKVGEETGELGNIMKTLAKFYQREVETTVDTLVDLIEPAMIVVLGAGIGFLLVAVLLPIYNLSSAF
ncbi:MAG: type II secretion system F family protein [Candidatus Pacebacteria bacterium]|nr:type II secretion system F family protein [Candidatus Paceibacterota bacterium]MDD5357097.1 type II secretion system F family protein [Candidatus Paceibacterota bacterium]